MIKRFLAIQIILLTVIGCSDEINPDKDGEITGGDSDNGSVQTSTSTSTQTTTDTNTQTQTNTGTQTTTDTATQTQTNTGTQTTTDTATQTQTSTGTQTTTDTATQTQTDTGTQTTTNTDTQTSTDTDTQTTDTSTDTDTDTDREGTFGEFTDESCTDGQYEETLPDLTVDISNYIDEVANARNPEPQFVADTLMSVLNAAYPYGAFIVRESPNFDREGNCALAWASEGYGWHNSWGLAIHECGHALDAYHNWPVATYFMAENYELPEPRGFYFPRSNITADRFHNTISDAAANSTYFDLDSVTGHQGLRSMYDEWAQYVHSVALDYLLYPHPQARRDYYVEYMLNFAWAAQRYLLWAKEELPSDFQTMMDNYDLRQATLALWGQTFTYYDAYANNVGWTPSENETRYLEAMREPDLLEVINDVRKAHSCSGL